MDIGVFKETKLTDIIYTQVLDEYRVIAAMASIWNRGGVALFYQESPILAVKLMRQFGANIIACQMATGERRWYIVGCYLAFGDRATIQDAKESIAEWTSGTELIVLGYLNVDLERTVGRGRDKDIAVVVATAGIEDILVHLLSLRREWNRDWKMWEMVRQWREVSSRTDYILGTDCRIFQNVAVRDLQHNFEHYMVLG